jgi:hypothetical protein
MALDVFIVALDCDEGDLVNIVFYYKIVKTVFLCECKANYYLCYLS